MDKKTVYENINIFAFCLNDPAYHKPKVLNLSREYKEREKGEISSTKQRHDLGLSFALWSSYYFSIYL